MNLRQMEIVTDVDKLNVDIQATCMRYKTIKQWAYIIHDKDDTRPHYHIYLNFNPSSADTKKVAEWFQIPENFIEKVKGRKTDMLLYLTHGNDSQKNKYQYPASAIVANFDIQSEIAQSKIIGDFEHYSYAEMLQYVNTLPVSEKTKAFTQLKKLWELECRCSVLKPDRKLKVMFITGPAGAGKTFYAKKFLKQMEYDFCVSSSSNDALQDYQGQKALILDDLRDITFRFEDFLKVVDNDTQSSIFSRFQNKVFVGDMIIITSSVPINYWYRRTIDGQRISVDDLAQLYRRISCYVEVKSEVVMVYEDGLDEFGKPKGIGKIYKNEIYDLKKKDKEKAFIFTNVFDQICDTHLD